MVQLPVMDGNDQTIALGKDDVDKVHHDDFNQICPCKKGQNTQPDNPSDYRHQTPKPEFFNFKQ
jgi:hypothetical protein